MTLTEHSWPTSLSDAQNLLVPLGLALGDGGLDAPSTMGAVGGLPERYSATWSMFGGSFAINMFPAETSPTDRTKLEAHFQALCAAIDEHLIRSVFPDRPADGRAARWLGHGCIIDLETRWSQPLLGVLQLHIASTVSCAPSASLRS